MTSDLDFCMVLPSFIGNNTSKFHEYTMMETERKGVTNRDTQRGGRTKPFAAKKNRAPLLYYIKIFASFQSHGCIQIGFRKRSIRPKIGIFVPCELEI